jgi:hypothetical protein
MPKLERLLDIQPLVAEQEISVPYLQRKYKLSYKASKNLSAKLYCLQLCEKNAVLTNFVSAEDML